MTEPGGATLSFEDTAIVFIHGLFSTAAAWTQMVQLVRQDPLLVGLQIYDDFSYPSAVFRLNITRRVPDLDDVADALLSYINLRVNEPSLTLVTHSQGGLVALRLLSRYLVGRQTCFDRTRLRVLIPYACPTAGSLFGWRTRRLFFGRHPQERGLRPLDPGTADAMRRVLLSEEIRGRGPLGFTSLAIGGVSDNVVQKASYRSVWPRVEDTLEDHESIIRPASREDSAYALLQRELLAGFDRYEIGTLAPPRIDALVAAVGAWAALADGGGLDALMDSLSASQSSGFVAGDGLRVPVAGSHLYVRLTLAGGGPARALEVTIGRESGDEIDSFRWAAVQGDLLALSRRLDTVVGGLATESGFFTATPEIHRAAETLSTAGVRMSPGGFGPPLTFGISHVDGEWIRTNRWVFSARDKPLTFDLTSLPTPYELQGIDASRPGLTRILGALSGS